MVGEEYRARAAHNLKKYLETKIQFDKTKLKLD